MEDNEHASSKKRLELLREIEYPFGDAFRSILKQSGKETIGPRSPKDPFENHPDKAKLDSTLAQWVAGYISDDAALVQLIPLAINFRYGDIEEEPGENLLTPKEREQLPFAKLVTDAWFTVALQANNVIREHHLKNYDDVGDQRELGMTVDEFARRFGRGKNSGHLPGH